MAQIFGFLEKAQLENTATDLTGNVAGLIWLNTASGKVKFYDGAITRAVVDEDSTQTLTGKTLTGNILGSFSPDGVESITAPAVSGAMLVDQHELNNMNFLHQSTPATPAAGGIKVYSKNDDQLYKLDSDGNEIQIGTGGGGLDVFHIEDFETNNASDFSTGNNVLYLGGGVLAGTLADETIDPISKTRSIKYTQAAGSLNDYFTSPAFDIDPKQAGNYCGFNSYFTYDGDAGDIKFVLYDATNGDVISSILDVVSSTDNPTRFRLQAFIPAGVASLRWGAQVVVENSGAILVCDDVEITSDPVRNIEIYASSEWESYTPVFQGLGTPTEVDVESRQNGDSLEIRARFRAGTVTADQMQMSLPNNLLIKSTSGANIMADYGLRSTANAGVHVLTNPSLGYLQFGNPNSATGDLPEAANGVLASGELTSFTALIPIEGWTNTTDATVETVELPENEYQVDGATDGALSSFTGVSDWLTLVSKDSTGIWTYDLNASYFTEFPKITPINASSVADAGVSVNYGTFPRFQVKSYDSGANSYKDLTFQLKATKAGTDYKPLTGNIIRPAVQVAYIKDVKASGTAGGTSSTAYSARDLNTVSGDSSFLSLTGNQVTLHKGSYGIEIKAPAYYTQRTKCALYNVSDADYEFEGQNQYQNGGENVSYCFADGPVVVDSTKVFEVRQIAEVARATDGWGLAVGSQLGTQEQFTVVKITKLR